MLCYVILICYSKLKVISRCSSITQDKQKNLIAHLSRRLTLIFLTDGEIVDEKFTIFYYLL